MIDFLLTNWPPILILVVGVMLVTIFLLLQTLLKKKTINFLSKKIFRKQQFSEVSAEQLLNSASSYLLMIGGLWVLLAVYFFY